MKLKSKKYGTFPFPDDYDVVRSIMLNKSDSAKGNNKFYSIEAHVSKDGKKFRLFSSYGRVGAPNPRKEERIPDQNRSSLDAAFESLVREKTSKKKGYREVAVASTKVGSEKAQKMVLSDDIKKDKIKGQGKPKKIIKLDPAVQKLTVRLYEEANQAIQRTLNTGQLNAAADNPLGTLTLTQIEDGRAILQEIQQKIAKDTSLIDQADPEILRLTDDFNTTIPQIIPMRPNKKAIAKDKDAMEKYLKKLALNNAEKLDEKEDMLDMLKDVEGMVDGFATDSVEAKYKEIGAEFNPLPKDTEEYKKVVKYVDKSRSRHHYWKSKVKNIWTIEIPKQNEINVKAMKKVGNIKPLFHGSRSGNILGICKNGLLMRPPGVYITGSMFGNGLYFADQSSKSEQYSMARFGGGGRGAESYFLFLADVALGKVKKYQRAQTSLNKPPRGYHSVQGEKGVSLIHNEFIVYNTTQNKLQYIIEFEVR